MSLARYRVVWTGGPGGQGVSTFHGEPADGSALADIQTFFDSIKGLFPAALSWSFPSTGDTIDLATGQIDGSWTTTTQTGVVGTSTNSPWAAGVGAAVRWETGVVHNGRRVRGRTFLTGLVGSAYGPDGTIRDADLVTIQNAATLLAANAGLVVFYGAGANGNGAAPIISAVVPDRVSWLTTRRT